MAEYPPVGFHFLVSFLIIPELPNDMRFQEVSGLDAEIEMESFAEGGQNRFTWQVPKKARYSDITLKRGMYIDSIIIKWFRNALENFVFEPANLTISLLNERHEPMQVWFVVNAIPKKWSISGFNAQENSIVIESVTLSYQYFNIIR
ncbi:phage tail protein [Solitalea sp. MAHUQ-68]|uniref:Phage tail protein n=1 Tax=Solitalea agri TaxID=2953739 RepID=A0A9X2F474_9SPHI|nr:phage tail protein [Solitalea agri]MCO4294452.1 phage tail protein [Solitalea agri]